MGHSLNSFGIKGDTRSLDSGSYKSIECLEEVSGLLGVRLA